MLLHLFHIYTNTDLSIQQYNPGTPQGYFTRDHIAWFQSTQRLRRLEAVTRGRIIPGHDEEVFVMLQKEKDIFT